MTTPKGLLKRGFVGPRYEGICGRLRFLVHELVIRTDVVLAARATDVADTATDPLLTIEEVTEVGGILKIAAAIDEAYGSGYSQRWMAPLGWGERLILMRRASVLVGFGWITQGCAAGTRYYAGWLRDGEYRVSRVGVLPAYRRRGYNTAFYALVLRHLFSQEATLVTVECAIDNLPSLAAIQRAGFRTVGRLRVLGRTLGGYVKWKS